ncbi:hypothetical protein V7O62_09925 [Methanolobus sp. ZRKC2]|uniref:hypothetical protein n=1 Tax=Methanolobus sp. ZRKC2 TaxID=3125783 RepID=UPI00325474EC
MHNANGHLSPTADLINFLYDIKYIILFYVLGDFFTTQHALNYGFEENGFLRFVMAEYGVWSLFILKLLFLVVVYFNYKLLRQEGPEWAKLWDVSKVVIGFVGIFLVVNNLMVIFLEFSLIQLIGNIPF